MAGRWRSKTVNSLMHLICHPDGFSPKELIYANGRKILQLDSSLSSGRHNLISILLEIVYNSSLS